MNKINIPKFNINVDKKIILPTIIALMVSITTWHFSNYFSSETLNHHIFLQILFFLSITTIDIITFDRLINRTNIHDTMILAVLPLLVFIILLFSSVRQVSFISLLTIVPLISTFLPFNHKNGIGLISLAISIALLNPISFFFIRNGFVTSIFLKLCVVLTLTFILILFPLFVDQNRQFDILSLGLLLIVTISSLILLRNLSVLLYPITALVSWVLPKIGLPEKLLFLILMILSSTVMLFTIQ